MRILPAAVTTGLALLTIAPVANGMESLTPDELERLEQAASTSVSNALEELLAVLSDDSSRAANRLSAVEQIVRQRLDYANFSRFALARYKSQFSEEQLDLYECEFDAYLSNYLGSRLIRYHQEQIDVFRATALPNRDVVLSTRISGGKYDQAVVTFLMRESNPEIGEWRAIDVSFEGTRVRKLLRAQFQSVLQQGGPDHLIALLQEKTPDPSLCARSDGSEMDAPDPLD